MLSPIAEAHLTVSTMFMAVVADCSSWRCVGAASSMVGAPGEVSGSSRTGAVGNAGWTSEAPSRRRPPEFGRSMGGNSNSAGAGVDAGWQGLATICSRRRPPNWPLGSKGGGGAAGGGEQGGGGGPGGLIGGEGGSGGLIGAGGMGDGGGGLQGLNTHSSCSESFRAHSHKQASVRGGSARRNSATPGY